MSRFGDPTMHEAFQLNENLQSTYPVAKIGVMVRYDRTVLWMGRFAMQAAWPDKESRTRLVCWQGAYEPIWIYRHRCPLKYNLGRRRE
jgi:hypothetical protein